MNQIPELNEEQAFALVEPGVTFVALNEEIQRCGMKLWVDSPDLGGGSVLGNTLESPLPTDMCVIGSISHQEPSQSRFVRH
ncbi:hypothetical protein K440DRAFT_631694 [Wilcoxina mikolae CBS 423.85]|nr:hypothetical protein K440DRAFT_631694 [Wilcoxina mikolae CBS 423.85]